MSFVRDGVARRAESTCARMSQAQGELGGIPNNPKLARLLVAIDVSASLDHHSIRGFDQSANLFCVGHFGVRRNEPRPEEI